MSQAELAEALGVARNTVARWERNKLEIGHPELIRLALDRLQTADQLSTAKRSSGGAALQHKLPVEFTSFIGREQEISAVRRLILTTPLLTLSGAGGSGKTRLALQVARELVDGFADGVCVVDLASLDDEQLVPRAVATALGVRERPGRSLVQTLQHTVSTHHLLLVLDNCEHLLNGCARLVEALLQSAAGLRILATSREPLGVSGEVTRSLAPLSFPAHRSAVAQVDLERFEATRLFVERARARIPDFVPSDVDAVAIAAICERLDGLPLAIELAAARIVVLSCARLATRLDEALPLLTIGHRTAPARQQTLRATLDWSHRLLSPDEQVVFRRMAVFAGGWNLEAAEDICRDDGPKPADSNVMDLLGRLVSKSLVVREEEAGEPRFRLLETIRQYAAERLAAAGEEAAWRSRHLAWCLAMAERTPTNTLEGGTRLAREHDNWRAALRWSIGAGEIGTGLRLAAAIWRFWYMRGHYSEGISWLGELLAHPDVRKWLPLRLEILTGAGQLATVHGRYAEAQAWLAESLALAEQLGDQPGMTTALHFLGTLAYHRGEAGRARGWYEQSLLIHRNIEELHYHPRLVTLVQLGMVHLAEDDVPGAAARAQEALPLARAMNHGWGVAGSLQILGRAAHSEGRLGRAQALLDESLALYRQIEHPQGAGYTLTALGMLALDRGEPARARDCLIEALAIAQQAGEALLIARVFDQLGSLVAGRTPARAVSLAGAAAGLRQGLGAPSGDPGSSSRDRAAVESWLRTARRALGEPGFSRAWRTGMSWPVESAVREAVSVKTSEVAIPMRHRLTPREREVAVLVARGYTNHQIAGQLIFTEATAAKHVEHILEKLGFTSRAQIAAWQAVAIHEAVEVPAS